MMGTIIGAILGFLAAVLPNAFNAMAEYFEHRKDMDKSQQQIEAAKAGVQVPVPASLGDSALVNDSAKSAFPPNRVIKEGRDERPSREDDDEAELEAGYVKPLFVRLFATLRAGVRPLITYGFFVVFVYVKLCALTHGLHVDYTPAVVLLPVVWDEGTQSLFAAVLAFWFGSRALEKQREAKAAAAGKGIAGD